jgi:ATP-dependent DNA ligase
MGFVEGHQSTSRSPDLIPIVSPHTMAMILYPPFPPMEALSVSEIPLGPEWQYEPKWDGFRCVVFREGKSVTLQSKSGKPLTRYFPDLVDMVRSIRADRFVLDGEIVVAAGKVFSFDALLQRIHPAESRVKKLAKETPALMIVFDLLADQSGVQIDRSLQDRRQCLEAFALKHFAKNGQMRLSPATTRLVEARKWLSRVGATLDGIVAKRRDMTYSSGNRRGMATPQAETRSRSEV